jgi:hypothetical protein
MSRAHICFWPYTGGTWRKHVHNLDDNVHESITNSSWFHVQIGVPFFCPKRFLLNGNIETPIDCFTIWDRRGRLPIIVWSGSSIATEKLEGAAWYVAAVVSPDSCSLIMPTTISYCDHISQILKSNDLLIGPDVLLTRPRSLAGGLVNWMYRDDASGAHLTHC